MCMPHKTGEKLWSESPEGAERQHWCLSVRTNEHGLGGSPLEESAFGWDISEEA